LQFATDVTHLVVLASIGFVIGCGGNNAGQPDASSSIDTSPPDPDACIGFGSPVSTDCAGTACAAIEIPNDELPDQGFRGYADPSIRNDPASLRLWMGYSFARQVPFDEGNGTSVATVQVETHVAHSDDGGSTWSRDGIPFPNTNLPAGNITGYFNSETVALAAESATSWFASRLAYGVEVTPDAGILVTTFMTRISHASSPATLGSSPEQVIGMTSDLPASFGEATDLNKLSGLDCAYWNDPGLFYKDGMLYLTAECVGQGTIHVFSAVANDDVSQLVWTDRGALTTPADATELGDDELDQADLEVAANGTIQLIVTPSHVEAGATLATHEGCRALVVDSLDSPALHRECGKLAVTSAVTASDLSSTGSCGYDASASGLGIVLARRPEGNNPGTLVKSLAP
jgi:hypothetical protein